MNEDEIPDLQHDRFTMQLTASRSMAMVKWLQNAPSPPETVASIDLIVQYDDATKIHIQADIDHFGTPEKPEDAPPETKPEDAAAARALVNRTYWTVASIAAVCIVIGWILGTAVTR